MVWIVLIAAAALLAWVVWAGKRSAEKRRFAQLMDFAGRREPVQPDLGAAANGYEGVALMRKHNQAADLQRIAQANAAHLRSNGASDLVVLSTLWGGVYAIDDDLKPFLEGSEFFASEIGGTPNADQGRPSNVAALAHLTMVSQLYPDEFERFLQSVGAQA